MNQHVAPRIVSTGFDQLDGLLGPLLPFLGEPSVVEISANADGSVFVERIGADTKRELTLEPVRIASIIKFCATHAGTTVTEDRPVFSGSIPGIGCRIEGLLPPVVRKPSLSIRRQSDQVLPLSAFGNGDGHRDVLHEALRARENIIVTGSTGSGKTSLTNALLADLAEIEPTDRILVIEDTAELRARHDNTLSLLTSDTIDQRKLLMSALRLAPDRILLGECRDGAAALTLLKTWNTGHPGGITTLHANSAQDAIARLAALCSEVAITDQTPLIAATVGLIVHIERHRGAPTITHLHRPTGTA